MLIIPIPVMRRPAVDVGPLRELWNLGEVPQTCAREEHFQSGVEKQGAAKSIETVTHKLQGK